MRKDTMEPVNPNNTVPTAISYQRSEPMEMGDHHLNNPPMKMKPFLKPRGPPPYSRGYSYPHHYPVSRPSHGIRSVVTTSFSMDEEREDVSSRHFMPPPHAIGHSHPEFCPPIDTRRMDHRDEPRHGPPLQGREDILEAFAPPHTDQEFPPMRDTDMDRYPPQHEMTLSRPTKIPPSPRGLHNDHPQLIHRSYSTGITQLGRYREQGPMKRNFWHHARPGDEYTGALPYDFVPPKRSKMSSSGKRDYVVVARSHPDEPISPEMQKGGPSNTSTSGWFNRTMSWEPREESYYRAPRGPWARSPPYREAGIGPNWSEAPPMPSPRGKYSSPGGGHYDMSPGHPWSNSRWRHPEEHAWGAPQHRDESESKYFGPESQEREGNDSDFQRQNTFESGSDRDPPVRFISGPPRQTRGMELVGQDRVTKEPAGSVDLDGKLIDKKGGQIKLLALPGDRISLSETLCLVRENIEVFEATQEDVQAPAPGRKHPVVVGQVGLRCIHCRHTTKSSERVKRAVCYPSSMKRIYRTAIDMKLDHFIHCKFVPDSLKETLAALKANNTRSTGTTMQYFIRAAGMLGMVDGPSGVRLVENVPSEVDILSPEGNSTAGFDSSTLTVDGAKNSSTEKPSSMKSSAKFHIHRNDSISSEGTNPSSAMDDASVPTELFTGKIALALPEDKMSLSPLRCFLREQVCAFSATEEDIAVRTPTTFSVSVGQVGIGCVHCLNQPSKLRLNRAVCFPFSIARIYQSVADIQRFHLGECKMVPPEVKTKFLELSSASSKGSKGLATRQYWVTSAKKIGLVDTAKGIRFGRDPSVPEEKAVSLDILAQVASNVTTVNRPLVLPEDKPLIAEFLYAVMDQLQPCRFTEADRNKRRLKDVGCIGVECKHCAGQVDSRKFFWSSVNAVESNFVSVHTHMMECKAVPEPLKENLAQLKKLRKEQTTALKTGSQKAFFARVWKRLHSEDTGKKQELQNSPESAKLEEALSGCRPTSLKETIEPKNETISSSPSAEKLKIVNEKMAVVSV